MAFRTHACFTSLVHSLAAALTPHLTGREQRGGHVTAIIMSFERKVGQLEYLGWCFTGFHSTIKGVQGTYQNVQGFKLKHLKQFGMQITQSSGCKTDLLIEGKMQNEFHNVFFLWIKCLWCLIPTDSNNAFADGRTTDVYCQFFQQEQPYNANYTTE